MANDALVSKFKNQEVSRNFPFITEYMEGSVFLDSKGRNTDTLTFKRQVHDAPPLVEGMFYQTDLPSANVLPIQTYWRYIAILGGVTINDINSPLFSGIGMITKSNLTLNIQTYMEQTENFDTLMTTDSYPYAGTIVKYKLWILRLQI
jgi:hypothetical protein